MLRLSEGNGLEFTNLNRKKKKKRKERDRKIRKHGQISQAYALYFSSTFQS